MTTPLIKFRNIPHLQIWERSGCEWMAPFYTDFEKNYDPQDIQEWMEGKPYLMPALCLGYLFMVFCGPSIMEHFFPKDPKDPKKDNAFVLKYPLAFWNLFLAAFSTWGAIRVVPELIYELMHYDLHESLCHPCALHWGAGATGFAVQMFCLSKAPELIDTLFIVLRKREIIFLHWYHHFTVLAFCWNSYITEASSGLYFVAMNYSVHAIMYFYYALMSLKNDARAIEDRIFEASKSTTVKTSTKKEDKVKPLGLLEVIKVRLGEEGKNIFHTFVTVPILYVCYSIPPPLITTIQISQMIVGTFIVISSIFFFNYGAGKYGPGECGNIDNLYFGAIIYSSYLLLFVQFFVSKYQSQIYDMYGIENTNEKKTK